MEVTLSGIFILTKEHLDQAKNSLSSVAQGRFARLILRLGQTGKRSGHNCVIVGPWKRGFSAVVSCARSSTR